MKSSQVYCASKVLVDLGKNCRPNPPEAVVLRLFFVPRSHALRGNASNKGHSHAEHGNERKVPHPSPLPEGEGVRFTFKKTDFRQNDRFQPHYKYKWFLFLFLFFFSENAFAQTRQSATEECGSDRRCRIQRIKDINQTRRRNAFQNDRNARKIGAEMAERERLKKLPRTRQPYTADLRASLVGIFGVGLGYQFADNFRAQVSWHLVDITNYFGTSIELFGNQFGVAVEYFLTTGAIAPFLSGGFYIYDGPAGTNFSSFKSADQNAVLHFAELGAGFDLQLDGYRARLMGAYKPLIYHQATLGDVHDASTKESLERTFESDMQIDIIIQLGYAF